MIARWDDAVVAARGVAYRRLREVARAGFVDFLSLPGAAVFGNAFACDLARGGPVFDEVVAACAAAVQPHESLVATLDARLAAIDVVGFVETFTDSFHELVAVLGWPAPARLQSHNIHAAAAPLGVEERALAESCTRLDRGLVDAARARAAARPARRSRASSTPVPPAPPPIAAGPPPSSGSCANRGSNCPRAAGRGAGLCAGAAAADNRAVRRTHASRRPHPGQAARWPSSTSISRR